MCDAYGNYCSNNHTDSVYVLQNNKGFKYYYFNKDTIFSPFPNII